MREIKRNNKVFEFGLRTLSVMAVFAVISGMLTVLNVCADTEPNNSFGEAEEIASGTHLGNVSSTDTNDYYRLNVSAGQTIHMSGA
ncbi:MAG: hypothetical protein ACE5KV_06900 [Thermoplasmata archaeon]